MKPILKSISNKMFKDYLDQIKPLFTDKDDFLFITLPLITLLGIIVFAGVKATAFIIKLF